MLKYVVLFIILNFSFNRAVAQVIKTPEGIIVKPRFHHPGQAHEIHIRVIDDHILRIIGVAEGRSPVNNSLMVLDLKKGQASFTTKENENEFRLETAAIELVVDKQSGSITYLDSAGKHLLSEQPFSRQLQPQLFEGAAAYSVKQAFETSGNDAWYGLGQHQDGLMNYKSYQVLLFQNNTEVAVPFLVSRKNYGILWDNNSITQFGDVRPYQPLNALKLFSKNGEQGYITATYSNSKNKPEVVAVERAETSISYEYLNDSKLFLPKEFIPDTGVVVWEGKIASDFEGDHKFRFTYGGYLKVWINDQLVLDGWRQNWNPGSAILDVSMEAGKQYDFKAEWIPYGGESYVSLKCLPPLTEKEQNQFSFNSEAGSQLDYYFVHGKNMDSVIAAYRQLTGKAVMLPKWAFGKWQSRERYKTQAEMLEVAKTFRDRKIPLDNIVLDWSYWRENEWGSQEFDEKRFSNPDSLIAALQKTYRLKFMISVWPKFYEGIPAYNEFEQKGWLYKRNIADRQRDWIGKGYVSTFYDAFNEGAQKGFWDLINRKLYSKGVDAWWMDASEPDILSNVSPQRRKDQMTPTALGPAALYLNAYPLQNAKGIYEGQRNADPGKRVFILTRSAFGGLQRYASVTWSGDIASRWHDMHAQISAGVNFSMTGLPYWTMDIGGFAVEGRFERPNAQDLEEWRELNTRWYQFGAFVPLFRVHGQFPFREIYNIAPETHPAYQSMLYYDKLRYRLLPYVYSLAGEAYHKDGTMMRGLVMDYPKDDKVININDQYLFGPSLLINPVYAYRQKQKSVYLPGGNGWYDLYTGKFEQGGNTISVSTPYERMPVYVKEGSIIPFGSDLQYTSEKPAADITLYVYTGRDASFTLYEDEGENYQYEKGAFATIRFDYNEKTKTLTIGKRQGKFNGMLEKRRFHIVWISKENPKGIDNAPRASKTIVYNGGVTTIKK